MLRRLLTETLGPELSRRKPDVNRATAILRTTVETVAREIYLVGVDEPDDADPGPAVWN